MLTQEQVQAYAAEGLIDAMRIFADAYDLDSLDDVATVIARVLEKRQNT